MDPVQVMDAVEAQIAMMQQMQDQFKRLDSTCKTKCLDGRYRRDLLSKNEQVCMENCTSKYLDFNLKTQIMLREMQEPQTLEVLRMQQMELGRQQGL